ncbi:hypothetical protein CFOL_v3_17177 [Cephalotus follicularis]|uniref:Uncharacterized protein n=1 Tax=Cephalotus follicularis TaxID=3775 RepID=A0A1Q3C0A2_CEPFO|nr:hypothetical protein CFOL_v3_17177 [Cephalotus follicularis]
MVHPLVTHRLLEAGFELKVNSDRGRYTVDTSDDWWKRMIDENGKVKKFRTRGIHPELEDKLKTMFSSVLTSGAFAYAHSSCTNYTGDANALEGSSDSHDSDLNVSGEDIDITQPLIKLLIAKVE